MINERIMCNPTLWLHSRQKMIASLKNNILDHSLMENYRTIPLIFLISLFLFGCSTVRPVQMEIDKEKFQTEPASLKIFASDVSPRNGWDLQVVAKVALESFPGCTSAKKPKRLDYELLGKAILTDEDDSQDILIPSGKPLLIKARSSLIEAGPFLRDAAWSIVSIRFTPQPGGEYLLLMGDQEIADGKERFLAAVFEKEDGQYRIFEKSYYSPVLKKTLLFGDNVYHCDTPIKACSGIFNEALLTDENTNLLNKITCPTDMNIILKGQLNYNNMLFQNQIHQHPPMPSISIP